MNGNFMMLMKILLGHLIQHVYFLMLWKMLDIHFTVVMPLKMDC